MSNTDGAARPENLPPSTCKKRPVPTFCSVRPSLLTARNCANFPRPPLKSTWPLRMRRCPRGASSYTWKVKQLFQSFSTRKALLPNDTMSQSFRRARRSFASTLVSLISAEISCAFSSVASVPSSFTSFTSLTSLARSSQLDAGSPAQTSSQGTASPFSTWEFSSTTAPSCSVAPGDTMECGSMEVKLSSTVGASLMTMFSTVWHVVSHSQPMQQKSPTSSRSYSKARPKRQQF
mmetsp:Transcript_89197/g.212981  ORF Transcript_89197/g.212981 Transcript_89197/m.212981 type:complete len:234 (-) Transcript_89197:463-1164(-)